MIRKYHVEWNESEWFFEGGSSRERYVMPLDRDGRPEEIHSPHGLITLRNIWAYGELVPNLKIDPTKSYMEVGAGIGGFISHVDKFLKPSSPRPLVIDPANYALMRDMLNFSLSTDRVDRERVGELVDRCNLILNPKKVNFVNKKLSDALEQHPELEGTIDVIVDNFGPCHWMGLEESAAIERKFLKPGGKIYAQISKDGSTKQSLVLS